MPETYKHKACAVGCVLAGLGLIWFLLALVGVLPTGTASSPVAALLIAAWDYRLVLIPVFVFAAFYSMTIFPFLLAILLTVLSCIYNGTQLGTFDQRQEMEVVDRTVMLVDAFSPFFLMLGSMLLVFLLEQGRDCAVKAGWLK